jgi:osmoprotectant transport system substrate-binding protein
MRLNRIAVFGAASLALVLGACTSGGGSSSPSAAQATQPPATVATASAPVSAAPSAAAGPSIASQLVLGGPPECPERPFCLKGLEETYGLQFKEFVALDVGGPLTVEALKGGNIGVGLLFTSDPAIAAEGFVLLADDRGLQLADNLVPVVRDELVEADPLAADVLNGIMAKLSQAELTGLNKAVIVDGQTPAEVAAAWLQANGFMGDVDSMAHGEVTVGSTNFYEQEILGELFAQALEHNGWQVERKFQLGNREIVFPALEAGEIDVLAEYAATALEFVNGGAGEATTDAAETAAKLASRLTDRGLTALLPAAATDQNGFAVTAETAARYGLTSISDLAKPAP